jgi:hypothetical protein
MRQGAGGDMMHEQQQGVEGGYMDIQTMGFNLVHPEGALTRLARSDWQFARTGNSDDLRSERAG